MTRYQRPHNAHLPSDAGLRELAASGLDHNQIAARFDVLPSTVRGRFAAMNTAAPATITPRAGLPKTTINTPAGPVSVRALTFLEQRK